MTWSVAAGFALAAIHLMAGRLRFPTEPPRSVWLSSAGGVSVAYVFVHVLPELHARHSALQAAYPSAGVWIENHVYLVALAGLVVFYGLERLARKSREQEWKRRGREGTSLGVFWLHIGSFAGYNFLIGYLLPRIAEEPRTSLPLFFVAMALHFLVIDHALNDHHKRAYVRFGRYVVTAAIMAGFLVGATTELSEAAVGTLFAFLAGGIILNVLKEELPEDRESRFSAFLVGTAVYAAVLVAV